MSKVHCISGITWKNSDSASFKVYASIAAVFSLGLVTATVRNYEILQLTVPYTWYVFLHCILASVPVLYGLFPGAGRASVYLDGFLRVKTVHSRSPCLRWVLAGHDGEKPLSPRQSMQDGRRQPVWLTFKSLPEFV